MSPTPLKLFRRSFPSPPPPPICPHPVLLPAYHHRMAGPGPGRAGPPLLACVPSPALRNLALCSPIPSYVISQVDFPQLLSLCHLILEKGREREKRRLVWKERENTLVSLPRGDCYSQCVTVWPLHNPGSCRNKWAWRSSQYSTSPGTHPRERASR